MTTSRQKLAEPDNSFSFNKQNMTRSREIIAKYPKGKEQSALIPLLDLAQRQNGGWLSRACIEYIASTLNLAPIRVYEVATFYTMFNLKPVGKFHVQICGTTPCWLRGAEELLKVCKEEYNLCPGQTSEDGVFTINEVECLGACVNAPMVQINDNYYEDLTSENFRTLLQKLVSGEKVKVGSQLGRLGSAPTGFSGKEEEASNASPVAKKKKAPVKKRQ